jgi:tight adherence protein C
VPVYVLVAALALTMSVPILVYSLVAGAGSGNRATRNLNARLVQPKDLRELALARSPLERIVGPLFRLLARPVRHLSPAGVVAAVERRIELAGVSWSVERVLVLRAGLGGGLLFGGVVMALRSGSAMSFLGAICAGAVGYVAPDTVLTRMGRARQLLIANQLPDTLDQLTICVGSGLGFDAALARISRSGRGPLAQEITLLLQELRVGVPRREALDNLLHRTDVPELRQFVHAVIQADSYGVPISRVLRSQAAEQREKRRFRAEERAMKLPVKVIFPLVFCILPVVFIVVLGPAYIKITSGVG